jgi:hypothetical protein
VLEATYTKPYELLAKAVDQTNRSKVPKLAENTKGIFEHQIIGSEKNKDPRLHVSHSSWLPVILRVKPGFTSFAWF